VRAVSPPTIGRLQQLAIAADVALYQSRVARNAASVAEFAERNAEREFSKAMADAADEDVTHFHEWLDERRARGAVVAQCHLCGATVEIVWDFDLCDHYDRRNPTAPYPDNRCKAGGKRAQSAIVHYAPGGPENIDADGRPTDA